jgi:hypothetical protein
MLGTFFTRGPPPALRARVFSGLNGSLGFLCSPPAAFGSHVGSLCSNLLCSRGGGRRAGPFGLELYALAFGSHVGSLCSNCMLAL